MTANRIFHMAIRNNYKSGYRWVAEADPNSSICLVDVTNFSSNNSPRQIEDKDFDLSVVRIETYMQTGYYTFTLRQERPEFLSILANEEPQNYQI